MSILDQLIEQLLADNKPPEDLLGEQGCLSALSADLHLSVLRSDVVVNNLKKSMFCLEFSQRKSIVYIASLYFYSGFF
ncbi:hypothetical protein [Shewanella xiamenensis]|uniref:hypothetical protein n=1 Tax=Shewanella xiamenensis TaxID=332186 RepID=UPI001CC5EA61|nr:hypothetical protein [Shewanella xiamenensis]BDA59968.1 hypothetical protein NUITMVS1_14310 [Shewanella xiamenensis]